jgi:beta-galactosidase
MSCPRSFARWLTCLAAIVATDAWSASADAPLPEGVRVVWDLSKAFRETTLTRERVCINGLWRWQPAVPARDAIPDGGWGWFKVPGCWPGITDYLQKDSQTIHRHPDWKDTKLGELKVAWYQREITVPTAWAGRRIALSAEYLNSYAAVFVDGTRAGEIRFPAGEADLTRLCRPGSTHILTMLVAPLPLKAVMQSYTDTASVRDVKGTVERRGLCGDVFLVSTPANARLVDVKLGTSVRQWVITCDAAVDGVLPGEPCSLLARITEGGREVKTFKGASFTAGDLKNGRISVAGNWKAGKLWDVHTPQNQYELQLSLVDAAGRLLDAWPAVRFGFREFWIDGRDFYLNGSRIFLSAVPLDNAQIGAAWATYDAARESLKRLRSLGINFVYTHNYGCEPGAHLSFAEILRAADDEGMLVALTQPHFSHYDWAGPDAERTNGYASHAAFYAQVAENHPSVVMYATSHNATGYNEDMNPDLIDGVYHERDQWSANNAGKALRAEAIIRGLDPTRIVYHHAGGNIGAMHTSNFYPNFVPVQELSDWFEHWASAGVKPVFLCEYGAPFTWDWAMYRGWYKGKREFGSAVVPWEFCLAEWNAQFFGDPGFRISEMEKRNLRWEGRRFREGQLWHRWDYPHQLGSSDFPERDPVWSRYYTDSWRAFRTWGVSATSPWEHHILFTLRPGLNRNQRQDLPVDWAGLQRPGFSPDYVAERYERMDLAYEPSDWVPTVAAQALMRNNQPLLAYVGGKPDHFTSQDHLFVAGETIEKQLIVINNSRQPAKAECSWSLALSPPVTGRRRVTVETGQQVRIPLRFALPAKVTPGEYRLTAKVGFEAGGMQEDTFVIQVLPRRPSPPTSPRFVVFDPKGETTAWLRTSRIRFDPADPQATPGIHDVLIVGKGALSLDGPAPNILAVREGLRVLVFEQTADVLEKRLGFRVAEYGLRNVFPRLPDHPALAGLPADALRDWRGEATLLPPRLKYALSPRFNGAPTVTWCGLTVTRLWRCGCQGSVASVLIEKPACGDFLPIVDGGFSLQYSPLLEYREGRGMVLFCQMDVTGRTERDPAAERLAANLIDYVSTWSAPPRREALYAGEAAGRAHLEAAGFTPGPYDGGTLKPNQMLILGPGGDSALANHPGAIATFLKDGGNLLAVGLHQEDADAFLPFKVAIKPAEHINAYFDPPGTNSPLMGVGPADVHNRDPRTIPLVSGGARVCGDGVLAVATNANVVFCQLAPWQFDYRQNAGLKRTFRRASFLLTRLLGNLGVGSTNPLLPRWSTVPRSDEPGRWLQGLYLDQPEEWDDPYRAFRW